MSLQYWVGAAITLALVVYLFVAMFKPEKF
jgi:K+-transporting ATPase KdpF subunit